ncbi:hypothetical protein [Pseudomonas entomophila]|uniref:Uncharacterized protein n=2 Tax=Pseudomonas entomophila TaxID=312306 RepID=Q1I7R9_PSEE4|nr:hypothetical protein [Pseudomonas entomophila]WMW07931.1 hypothetical protein RAH46_11485 [Pseudomonas entomophila]CAK16310.1 hypothetical protein PSEEN3577 [Pseudomonas entomophila L48]
MLSLPFHGVILLEKSEKNLTDDGAVHVALCAMAVEAFLQDFKSFYQSVSKPRPYSVPRTLFKPAETRFFGGGLLVGETMEYIQRDERWLMALLDGLEKEGLKAKYEKLLIALVPGWKEGEDEVFKNLSRLVKLRNSLVHIKSDELELDEEQNVNKPPREILELQRLGVIGSDRSTVSWIFMLDDARLVKWARVTAVKIIKAVLESAPDLPVTSVFRDSYIFEIDSLNFEVPT